MRSMVLVVVAFGASCTKANPIDCGDGNCTDPAHPFCDSDGALEGHPNTCIAVSCTPMELAECRGDDAVICDATGANYMVTTCELGCDPSLLGCVECVDNSQCVPDKPTCDAQTRTCRACAADADCTSQICDKPTGTCRDPSTVIYAAPNGAASGTCGTQDMPCSLTQAFTLIDTFKSAVRLAPGNYTSQHVILDMGKVATLFGAGATLFADGSDPVDVSLGARLAIRDLTIKVNVDTPAAINCDTNTAAVSSVDLDNVTISQSHPANGGVLSAGCDVRITNSHFDGVGGAVVASTKAGHGSNVTIDRSILSNTGIGTGPISSDLSMMHVQNSLFLRSHETGNVDIQFSTLVDTPLLCQLTFRPYPKVANSIVFGTTSTDVSSGTGCTYSYDLMSPQSMNPVGDHLTLNMDPKFKSAATDDYHLLAGSPAIDAADPSVQVPDDFDGTARPQGAASDLGAFEFH